MRLLVLLVLALSAFLIFSNIENEEKVLTTSDGFEITLRIADNELERRQGLMNTTIAENEGMLFVFERDGIYTFWMKNVLQELDMVFLDKNFRVVAVMHKVPPCTADPCPTYAPDMPFRYVVELHSGMAAKHGIQEGNTLALKV